MLSRYKLKAASKCCLWKTKACRIASSWSHTAVSRHTHTSTHNTTKQTVIETVCWCLRGIVKSSGGEDQIYIYIWQWDHLLQVMSEETETIETGDRSKGYRKTLQIWKVTIATGTLTSAWFSVYTTTNCRIRQRQRGVHLLIWTNGLHSSQRQLRQPRCCLLCSSHEMKTHSLWKCMLNQLSGK